MSAKKEKVEKLIGVKKFIRGKRDDKSAISASLDERGRSRTNQNNELSVSYDSGVANAKVPSAKMQRLQALRKLGLYPHDKNPFSKASDDQREVEALWKEFLLHSQSYSVQSSNVLKKIVASFNPFYTHWNDEFEPDALHRPDTIRKSFFIPSIDKRGANAIVAMYQTYITSVVDAIRDGKTVHSLKGLEVLYMVNLLTRLEENKAALTCSSVLNPIISIIKMVLVKLKEPFSVNIKNLEDPCDVEHIYIQVTLMNCYQILLNYITFQNCWKFSAGSVVDSKSSKIIDEAKEETLRQGLLKIIKGYLDHLQSMIGKDSISGSQEDFLLLLLNNLGATLQGNPSARERLIHTGLLELLLGWIGWSDRILASDVSVATAATNPRLRDEFRIQLLCMQCLKEGVEGNITNTRRISALGGWEKLIDSVLWVTEVFSINPLLARTKLLDGSQSASPAVRWSAGNKRAAFTSTTSFTLGSKDSDISSPVSSSPSEERLGLSLTGDIDQNKQNPPPDPIERHRTPELQQMFDLLFSMCLCAESDDARNSTEAEPTQSMELSKVNRVIVNILIDLFNVDIRNNQNNSRVRLKMRTEYPELQFFVLEFFVNLVTIYNSSTLLLHRYRLWDALFSNSFYYCGMQDGISIHPSIQEKDESRDFLFSKLRVACLRFLEYTASIEVHDNIDEMQKVLEILDTYHHDHNAVQILCQSLIAVMQNNLIHSQKSFARLNVLPLIAKIIHEHHTLNSYFSTSTDEVEKKQFFTARFSVLTLLKYMLFRNEEMILGAIGDSRIVGAIFSLLFEPHTRSFAISLTVQMMSVRFDTKCTEDSSDMVKLYEQYFKLFRRAQMGSLPTHFELLLLLLDGIRSIISQNPKTQKLFKDVGAFLNITTILNSEANPERIPELCIEVLKTLTSMMSNNQKNKDYMSNTIGYDTLRRLILRALLHDLQSSENDGNNEPTSPSSSSTHSGDNENSMESPPATLVRAQSIEEQLKRIQPNSKGILSEELVPLLFEMLVDGNFDINSNYTIRNPDVVLLMFSIALHLPSAAKKDLLYTFIQIVDKCPLNQALCCSRNLIFHLLELIPSVKEDSDILRNFISLIEVLGAHNITVKEVKRLFSQLKSEPGDFRPIAETSLMKALQFMAISRTARPSTFFDFDGKTSALLLPPIEKWPNNHGYAFAFWFRVESFLDPADKPRYQPRLVSFLDENGFGIELHFLQGRGVGDKTQQLCISISSVSGKNTSNVFNEFFVKTNRWYFITLTHNNHRKFRIGAESEVKLYVNGQLKQKIPIKYPQLPPLLNKSIFGNNIEVQSNARRLIRRHPFYGQMGPIMVFAEQLSSSQAKYLYSLSAESSLTSGTSCFGELESKLLLYYNSTARLGKFFLDLVPEKNRDRRMDARQVGKIYPCLTRDVKDIIHCLGGIKVILPMFAQLDQPLVPQKFDENNEPVIDYTTDTQHLLQALALLGDMLSKSNTNQVELERCQGFPVIGFLLEQASPEHLTSETLVTLEDMVHKLEYRPLLDDLWKNVVFNWRIWIYANVNVQWDLFVLLHNQTKADRDYMRKTVGVQELLDALYYFYWYQPRGIRPRGKDPVHHRITKKLVGQRPKEEELRKIRKSIFGTLKLMVSDGITEAETSAICSAIIENLDPLQVVELMSFTLLLLRSRVSGFVEHLLHLNAIEMFIMMLRNDSEDIRILSLQLIAFLSPKRKQKDRSSDYVFVAKTLREFPFTRNTYSTLYEILIGFEGQELSNVFSTPPPKSDDTETRAAIRTINIDENVKIVDIHILPVIFELALDCSLILRQSVMQDIYLLLSNSSENREKVCSIPYWQNTLFSILAETARSKSSMSSPPPTTRSSSATVVSRQNSETASVMARKNSESAPVVARQNSDSSTSSSSAQTLSSDSAISPSTASSTDQIDSGVQVSCSADSSAPLASDVSTESASATEEMTQSNNEKEPTEEEIEMSINVVQEFVFNIFKVLLLHGFSSEKEGNKILQKTLGYLQSFDAEGILDYVEIGRILLTKLTTAILSIAQANVSAPIMRRKDSTVSSLKQSFQAASSGSSAHTKDMDFRSPVVLANYLQYLTCVEEFLFYSPPSQEIQILQKRSALKSSSQLGSSLSISPGSAENMASNTSGSKKLYNPAATTTALTMHFDGANWADLALARHLLDTMDLMHFFDANFAMDVEQALAKSVTLRPGGIPRLALRIALTVIREGDIRSCVENVPRIRSILDKELSGSSSARGVDVNKNSIYVLSSLLLTLQSSLKPTGSTPQAQSSSSKSKAIVPLMKDLLRACMQQLPPGSLDDKQLQYFTESGTIKEFTESFNTSRWAAIISWAEQIVGGAAAEDRGFISPIEKQRNKLQTHLETVSSRIQKQTQSNVRKMEQEFQNLHGKLLQPEIDRKRKLARQMDVQYKANQRQWARILRSLTNERAPWGDSNSESKVPWKLDKTENFSRMRLKLKRNYHFDPHAGAAREQAPGDSSSSVISEQDGKEEEEKQLKIFSGMRLAAVGEEIDEDAELKEINDDDVNALMNAASAQHSDADAQTGSTTGPEKLCFTTYCELVTPMKLTVGRMELTTTHLYFYEEKRAVNPSMPPAPPPSVESESSPDLPKELKIPLDRLREVHLRRYLLRRSALEIFLIDRSNYFLNFKKRDRIKVYKEIIALNPPNLTYFETGTPEQILKKSDLTRRWQMRKISNFDYLMQLNKIAGRTFNDLTQYPVFPWILADYESETIDLNDSSIYRDLSKPIGALNAERLKMFISRYENFVDEDIPKFHYGSHYSSSGIVLFYLIRMEPFTTYFLQLQGGKFDHADRMFGSIPRCWHNVLNSSADVKELIPEFFCSPDFLLNSNKFNLGVRQGGQPLGDVELPNWAKDADSFIRINRAALESEYVSLQLHHWVDLVFGFKQRGRDAVDAYNVFYYLTYEGAVDIDQIEDEDKRRATIAQIDNFGQTPAQLLRKPHQQRLPCHEAHQDLCSRIALGKLMPKVYSVSLTSSNDPLLYVCMPNYFFHSIAGRDQSNDELLITLSQSRYAACHKFQPNTQSPNYPFSFEPDPLATTRRKVGIPFAAELSLSSSCFACTSDGKMIISCGHFDNSVNCSWIDNSRPSQNLLRHKDLVTCLALGVDGRTLVTGSKDTTLLVWEILYQKGSPLRIDETPKNILYGHNDDVTCVAVDIGLDICVSGSNDGTCIVHNLRHGEYLRSIPHPSGFPISLVYVSTLGHIAFFSQEDRVLFLYSINGHFLNSIDMHERVQHMVINKSADCLITSSADGTITFRQLHDQTNTYSLKIVQRIPTKSKCYSLTMSPDETYLIAALEDGRLMFVTCPDKYKCAVKGI